MKILIFFSLPLSFCVQAYTNYGVNWEKKSMEFHALPMHASPSGKDTSVGYLK